MRGTKALELALDGVGAAVEKVVEQSEITIAQEKLHVVGLTCLRMGTDRTISALEETHGVALVGAQAEANIPNAAAWDKVSRTYGWYFQPFKMQGNHIIEEGKIIPYNIMRAYCKCGEVRLVSCRSIKFQEEHGGFLCRKCNTPFERDWNIVRPEWRAATQGAWQHPPEQGTAAPFPRVWGVYPLASNTISAWHWEPADLAAERLAKRAYDLYRCTIRPLSQVREEQTLTKIEGEPSHLKALLLEASNVWQVGWKSMFEVWGMTPTAELPIELTKREIRQPHKRGFHL